MELELNAESVNCRLQVCSFSLQIALSLGTVIIFGPPEARQRQKVPTVKHVELYCSLPLIGFLTPLAYNVALILLCSIYAFLTRKLPENYNESWYV